MNMKSKPAREHARRPARTGNSSAMSRIHALDTSEKITMIRSGISSVRRKVSPLRHLSPVQNLVFQSDKVS